jgi:hypothetical protein
VQKKPDAKTLGAFAAQPVWPVVVKSAEG